MMSVRFQGRVLPEVLNLTIRKQPRILLRDSDLDYDMTFDVTIVGGKVIIDCGVQNYRAEDHYVRLLCRAFDLSNAAVNLAAFSTGSAALVSLETSIDLNGQGKVLVL